MTALLASLIDRATDLAKGGLAVVGATFLGAIVIGFLANLAAQMFWAKKLPISLLRFVRVIGGLSSGFVVGMFVFGDGGGWGLGPGTGSAGKSNAPGNAVPIVASLTPSVSQNLQLGVTLLGGQHVLAAKFYRVDGDSTNQSLQELKAKLAAVDPKLQLRQLTLRIYDDSVAEDHPAVVELESWAKDNGWRIAIEKIPATIPDLAGAKP